MWFRIGDFPETKLDGSAEYQTVFGKATEIFFSPSRNRTQMIFLEYVSLTCENRFKTFFNKN